MKLLTTRLVVYGALAAVVVKGGSVEVTIERCEREEPE